jgi:hypothetical protein
LVLEWTMIHKDVIPIRGNHGSKGEKKKK